MKLRNLLLSLLLLVVSVAANAQLTKNNAQQYYAEFKNYFVDDICTELAVPYSAMTDEQLRTTMSAMPEELVNIALKVKNNAWGKREKEFRVFEAKPYSNSYNWSYLMNVRQYSELQNPTGISADNEYLLIFVGNELPDSISMELSPVAGNMTRPLMTNVLVSGLNMVKIPDTEGDDRMLFIQYYVDTDTTATSKKLADYPNVPIHIEGGYVNGYFDLSRHTDEDWRDMTQNMMKHYSVQVLGEKVLFHMELKNVLNACPNTITDAIKWWDECVKRQHELMGADKYYDRWNDLIMAKDGYEGMFMYATETYTYYEHYTLPDILPWEKVYADPGQMWGPAHEIGHVNQNAINIVSCTEASNNLFANAQIFRTGKTTTRGNGVSVCRDDFSNKIPFPLRGSDIIAKSRMFFQLYLYFHAAGKDTTFWPRVFEALRKNPLDKGPKDRNWISLTQAKDDQLRFAEVCCEVAQMDLSEFFEAWGMFEPMTDAGVGDYGNFIVNLTREEAEASRARMQRFEKKGGHLIFIEDRIKPSPRTDGVAGNRLNFNDEFVIGKMGSTGQWGDYIDESVKAQGYYYARSLNTITIKASKGAKGALGFKLYNAQTGELLDFNNELKLKVPVAYANAPLLVVAAQADGTDYPLPNVADSDDEEMELEALEATLKTVKSFKSNTTKNGAEIGLFYVDAMKGLNALYNEAKAAADNKDTSKHTYQEWIELLEDAMEALRNDPSARAYLKELDVYIIANAAEPSRGLCYDRYGLKTKTTNEVKNSQSEKQWMFESAGKAHHYYIMNKNGLYINDIAENGTSCSATDRSAALVFKANYLDDGTVYFTTGNGEVFLTMDVTSYDVVAGNKLVSAAAWGIIAVEMNNTAVEELEREGEKAGGIYDLQGRRVAEPVKGIYIIDGKKVLVK
ncbi:MAG: M60 family metallopeptidase [Bacteroidaceae bacterium]|nr:M60 family metallopeptidase [Bacteroidaceae bacterium]